MKSNSKTKKILSAIAVLAVSATAVAGIASAFKRGDKGVSGNFDSVNYTTVSTARGEVRSAVSGKTYYVSPTASDDGDGLTEGNPIKIEKILHTEADTAAVLQPGDTVIVAPGDYNLTNPLNIRAKGTFDSYINIQKKEGAEGAATIKFYDMDCLSTMRGVQIYGDYIHWNGIDVAGAGDNGMYVGGSFNTVENSQFYDNRDTGLQLGRSESAYSTIDRWPSFNLIKNCTSFNNYDNESLGENADGFAAKLTLGYGNVFDGCIAYRNSDDGWDLYAYTSNGNIGAVMLYNCVSFENGFIAEPQGDFHKKFSQYDETKNEANLKAYTTKNGDGNGFKLGGQKMEGDVVMKNCLAFNNRLHGVTDNSNPGFIYIEGVTSYDNGANINYAFDSAQDQPVNAALYGNVTSENAGEGGNINVARHADSYNGLKNVLSVKGGVSAGLSVDEYRGSVAYSYFNNGAKATKVEEYRDLATNNGEKGTEVDALVASSIFKTLPIVKVSDSSYTYNLTGKDNKSVHSTYRNEDGSINMQGILEINAGAQPISGHTIGADFSKTSYDEYEHFNGELELGQDPTVGKYILERSKESLTIGVDTDAVYQDFDVLNKMLDVEITWESSDPDVVEITDDISTSPSRAEYRRVIVYRGDEVKTVTLTAHLKYNNLDEVTKTFELTVQPDTPGVGRIVAVTDDNEEIFDGGVISIIVDRYKVYHEPAIKVENSADYNGKLLKDSQYTLTKTYMYAPDKNSQFVEVKGFTPSKAGVFQITVKAELKDDPTDYKTLTYTIYVASTNADVDFVGGGEVVVNRDGFSVGGSLSNVTGKLYVVASEQPIADISVDNIKTQPNVIANDFRAERISFQFENTNTAGYYVYYALSNVNGEITSDLYTKQIGVVEITTPEQFNTVANGTKLGTEDPSSTIYLLKNDISFASKTYTAGSESFKGLLNGNNHTVSDVTVNASATAKASLFYGIKNATIMNIKFDKIKLTNSSERSGIIGTADGGFIHNVAITNIYSQASNRAGGLIGQAVEGTLVITNVSVVNPLTTKVTRPESTDVFPEYIIQTPGQRVGGIIGYMQGNTDIDENVNITISNCYVSSGIYCSQQGGGIIGAFNADKYNVNGYDDWQMHIDHCVFNGDLYAVGDSVRLGGIVGYHANVGGSILSVSDCVDLGHNKWIQGGQWAEIDVPQKNSSGIFGGYEANYLNCTVTNCIARLETHNTGMYDVTAVPTDARFLNKSYISDKIDFDTEYWTYAEEIDAPGLTGMKMLPEPYLTLNYIEV